MKCPYCAEEIYDNALKCKYCGEWLPSADFVYPVDETTTNSINLVVFNIEGKSISIQRKENGDIFIYKDNEIIKEIPKYESGIDNMIEICNHIVRLRFEDNSLFGIRTYPFGFRISIDGKPVKGTLDDPQEKILFISIAFFGFAALRLIELINLGYYRTIIYPIVFICLAILTKKAPIIIASIGLLYGIFATIVYSYILLQIINIEGSLSIIKMPFYLLLFNAILTIVMIKGLIAAISLRKASQKRLPLKY